MSFVINRRFWFFGILAPAVAGLTLFFLFTRKEQPPEYLSWVPYDAAGILIIRSLPESLESLKSTRLGEWIELGDAPDSSSPARDRVRKAAELYRGNASSLLLCLHRLKEKENGSLKPEMTVFLEPRSGRSEPLAEALIQYAGSRFEGGEAERESNGRITVIRGKEPGQEFFLETCDGFIAASNSADAWEELQAMKKMTAGKKLMPPWYSGLTEHPEADIYIYFRGITGWIPGFVYTLTSSGAGFEDSYTEF